MHLKFLWTLFKNVHCQGLCIFGPCISRPYCTYYNYLPSSVAGAPLHTVNSDFILILTFKIVAELKSVFKSVKKDPKLVKTGRIKRKNYEIEKIRENKSKF